MLRLLWRIAWAGALLIAIMVVGFIFVVAGMSNIAAPEHPDPASGQVVMHAFGDAAAPIVKYIRRSEQPFVFAAEIIGGIAIAVIVVAASWVAMRAPPPRKRQPGEYADFGVEDDSL